MDKRALVIGLLKSRAGPAIHFAMRAASCFYRSLVVYGFRDKTSGEFRSHTRVGATAIFVDRAKVAMGDHVWIGHYSVIDGSNGVTIGEGVQMSFWVGIFSHSSHISARLYGRRYIEVPKEERKGYVRGSVTIGAYTCVCAGAIILPGVTIGKGALIAAGSVVSRDVPDFGIVRGSPARLVGDTRRLDAQFLDDPEIADSYFAPEAVADRIRLAQAA